MFNTENLIYYSGSLATDKLLGNGFLVYKNPETLDISGCYWEEPMLDSPNLRSFSTFNIDSSRVEKVSLKKLDPLTSLTYKDLKSLKQSTEIGDWCKLVYTCFAFNSEFEPFLVDCKGVTQTELEDLVDFESISSLVTETEDILNEEVLAKGFEAATDNSTKLKVGDYIRVEHQIHAHFSGKGINKRKRVRMVGQHEWLKVVEVMLPKIDSKPFEVLENKDNFAHYFKVAPIQSWCYGASIEYSNILEIKTEL